MENIAIESNKDTEKHTCLNCKYFHQHYVKCSVNYHAIEHGHCANKYLTRKANPNIPFIENCKHWQKDEKTVYNKYENTAKAFHEISIRLNEIAFIIKEKI